MKRSLLLMLAVFLVISMVGMLASVGCKVEAAADEETAVTDEVVDEVVEEVVEEGQTEEEEEVVASEEVLYIGTFGWWGFEFAQQIKYGMVMAEKFWNESFGQNVVVDFTGPMDTDAEKVYEGLETAIARNPVGIFHMNQGLGEEKILLPYQENGGIVFNFGGTPTTYATDGMIGNDLTYFGELEAKKAIELAGESFTYAIGTLPESAQHQSKMEGIHTILDQYDTIEFAGLADDGSNVTEGVQNYTAFLTAHPDIDVLITTSGTGGANASTALEEAGYEPGEIIVISADVTEAHIAGLKSGYITQVLGTDLSNFGFYAISIMHLRHLNPAPITKDDIATGHLSGPVNITLGNPWIDSTNADVWSDLNFSE